MAHPLIPLIVLVLILGIAGLVGYVIYSIATDVAAKTNERMTAKNVTIGKDGVRIAVKSLKEEDYVGQTQNILVSAWNMSSWPAYKSRFWNKDAQAKGAKGAKDAKPGAALGGAKERPAVARAGSGQGATLTASGVGKENVRPAAQRAGSAAGLRRA